MGFSFKKLVKPPKAIRKVVDGGIKNIGLLAKDPKKALGNYTDSTLGVLTLGQGKTIDAFTGGGYSAARGSLRGNTKDIARIGMTVGAGVLTGGAGAFAVNKAFSSGANPLQAALAGAPATQGTEMSWLNDFGTVLNNPIVSDLVSSSKRKPSPPPAQQVIYVPPPAAPITAAAAMDKKTKLMIGGGVLALFMILIFGMKKR